VSNNYQVLTDEQVQHFLTKGYLTIKGCIDPELAQRWTDRTYQRLGYDKQDPNTWEKEFVWMYPEKAIPIKDLSEKAWLAICDVIGGEDRIEDQIYQIEGHFDKITSAKWNDAFIVNFHRGSDQEWEPPSPDVRGWHVDGGYFRHFLNSREQALLTILLWSNVAHQGGATFIATDSIKHVARYLADRPEGVPRVPANEIVKQCTEFVEVTGEIGDFTICHPFMIHASSNNLQGTPRFMSNPPVVLKEQLNFNRPNPTDFSLVERGILQALDLERLDFQPTAPYESDWDIAEETYQTEILHKSTT
jgi:hypothetical protein